jgi:hypothetical protein
MAKTPSREQLEDRIKELKQYIKDSKGTTDKLRESRFSLVSTVNRIIALKWGSVPSAGHLGVLNKI